MSQKRINQKFMSVLIISILILNFNVNYAIPALNVQKLDIDLNTVNYRLEGNELVFLLVLDSNLTIYDVDFNLNFADERYRESDLVYLNWSVNKLEKDISPEEDINLEFRLLIKGTSDIPGIFKLSVQTKNELQEIIILPFSNQISPDGFGGSGSAVSSSGWSIAGLQITEDSIGKGDSFTTGTLFLNWNYVSIGPVKLNFRFDCSTYTISDDWVFNEYYNTGQSLPPAWDFWFIPVPGIKIIGVSIPWHGTDGSKHFAFNKGTWTTDCVKGIINGYGSYETSFYTDSISVTIPAGTHPVFVVYCTNDKWYDYYLDPASYIEAASSHFENNYDIILHPGSEFTWAPSSDKTTQELLDFLIEEGGDALGLNGDWIGQAGTHPNNHGFDVLAGFTGYRSNHCGMAPAPGNYLVVTGGNSLIRLLKGSMDNLFQHELSHCYDAEDRWDWDLLDGHPSVMSKPIGFLKYNYWGYTDHDIIESNSDQFDGY